MFLNKDLDLSFHFRQLFTYLEMSIFFYLKKKKKRFFALKPSPSILV